MICMVVFLCLLSLSFNLYVGEVLFNLLWKKKFALAIEIINKLCKKKKTKAYHSIPFLLHPIYKSLL